MHVAFELLISFSKVGSLAWGGGPAMVPLMQAEFVEKHAWMTDEQFVDALAAGYALPGPIATKMSVWFGWEVGGFLGVVAALVGMVLPSALMIAVVLALFTTFKDHPRVQGMMTAVRPVVLALLTFMVLQIGPKSVLSWHTGVLAAVALGLLFLKVHPAWLILAAAGFGAVAYGS
ncbi:MAG: chromate transporter [Proteobacteria bacterium]|nr:chromate transporter [Pseudomonadota bacterium]